MRKLQFDLYLSLGMHGRLGRDVIEQVEEAKKYCKMYDVSYYSPCDDEIIKPNEIIDARPNLRRMRWFVEKDDGHVDVCRALLILTGDKSSSGTLWEAARMYYKNHRPVFLVAPKMYHHLLANFSTIKAHKIFSNTESAIKWLAKNKRKLQMIEGGL
jgi:nucleoside 2-deoxyribosyltransferase